MGSAARIEHYRQQVLRAGTALAVNDSWPLDDQRHPRNLDDFHEQYGRMSHLEAQLRIYADAVYAQAVSDAVAAIEDLGRPR
jgi:hypothetical protein